MIILLHSSKAMRAPASRRPYRAPQLLAKTTELDAYLKTLPPTALARIMHVSPPLAAKVHQLIASWHPGQQSLAIDSFMGDIYSGLQAHTLTGSDRDYADKTLYILSGLYGVLRPYDSICPYRCEMGYQFPKAEYANLYAFWGKSIANCLPPGGLIVNLAAVEYTKTITPFVSKDRIITPRFLTVSPVTGVPVFVVVHAKIARGAFARWLVRGRITSGGALQNFKELGYQYDQRLSTPGKPTFVCKKFGGIGLSTRLLKQS